jgi:hypothetical protein
MNVPVPNTRSVKPIMYRTRPTMRIMKTRHGQLTTVVIVPVDWDGKHVSIHIK